MMTLCCCGTCDECLEVKRLARLNDVVWRLNGRLTAEYLVGQRRGRLEAEAYAANLAVKAAGVRYVVERDGLDTGLWNVWEVQS